MTDPDRPRRWSLTDEEREAAQAAYDAFGFTGELLLAVALTEPGTDLGMFGDPDDDVEELPPEG